MDGTTKQGHHANPELKAKALTHNPVEELAGLASKRRKVEANEEDLKKYEEQVFVETFVDSKNYRNKREIYTEFKTLRAK